MPPLIAFISFIKPARQCTDSLQKRTKMRLDKTGTRRTEENRICSYKNYATSMLRSTLTCQRHSRPIIRAGCCKLPAIFIYCRYMFECEARLGRRRRGKWLETRDQDAVSGSRQTPHPGAKEKWDDETVHGSPKLTDSMAHQGYEQT